MPSMLRRCGMRLRFAVGPDATPAGAGLDRQRVSMEGEIPGEICRLCRMAGGFPFALG